MLEMRNEHPTQALLDAYSIREKLGEVKGKKWLSLEILLIQSGFIEYILLTKTRC